MLHNTDTHRAPRHPARRTRQGLSSGLGLYPNKYVGFISTEGIFLKMTKTARHHKENTNERKIICREKSCAICKQSDSYLSGEWRVTLMRTIHKAEVKGFDNIDIQIIEQLHKTFPPSHFKLAAAGWGSQLLCLQNNLNHKNLYIYIYLYLIYIYYLLICKRKWSQDCSALPKKARYYYPSLQPWTLIHK